MSALVPASSGDDRELVTVLQNSLYPGASTDTVRMVLAYCKAAGLDPMQKPVHAVPMYDRNIQGMRDVVMPGIGLYRIQAARSGQLAGISEPEFGPDVHATIGGSEITYPAWCRVTVKRQLANGAVADFTAVERWLENYAIKGGKEKSIAPNAMWQRRPYAQLAKCAQAQALRMGFPEIGAAPTAEEMEGKPLDAETVQQEAITLARPYCDEDLLQRATDAALAGLSAYGSFWTGLEPAERKAIGPERHADFKAQAESVG